LFKVFTKYLSTKSKSQYFAQFYPQSTACLKSFTHHVDIMFHALLKTLLL